MLGALSTPDLLRRMENEGIAWQVGPYAIRAKTDLADVADGLRFLYSDYAVVPSTEIVDAEIRVRAKTPFRRRVSIEVDGEIQYDWLPRNLVVPMIEWALNVCVFHRSHQFFMLHAAVVERDGKAIVMSGRAGSGKSTLCAALVHRGWRLLSDEVCPIRPADGRIQPVPRPVSLKEDSIQAVKRWAPAAVLGPEWRRTAKGTVAHMRPPAESVARSAETASPAWLLFPRFNREGETALLPVTKAQAFMRAAEDAFNYSVLGRVAFETLAAFIDRCACFELRHSDLERAMPLLADLTRPAGVASGS